ncbi:MAG: hypothetical protein AUJ89_05465 [Candidatus Omnitrophica bacterium CG1_02_43_210]|nr:MAG: hypothetical protein AUJ89_05465 [Candidatus Omnitrophica bacterium CG1_02_43_210]
MSDDPGMDNDVKKAEVNKLITNIFNRPAKAEAEAPSSLFRKTAHPAAPEKKPLIPALAARKAVRPTGCIGLDIGTSSVKAVQFTDTGAKKVLESIAVEEFSAKDYEGPGRDAALKEILVKLKHHGKLNGQCAVTFSMPELSVEFIRLPQMPQAEMLSALDWELKERYSFDSEVSVFDYTMLAESVFEGEKHQEILAVIAPRKRIVEHLQILSGVGIKVAAIEPAPFAAFESFGESPAWKPEEVTALLDMGAKYTTINLIKDNSLCFSRVSFVAGESMTKAIADYCQLERGVAERYKKDFGMSKMVLEEDRKNPEVAGELRVKIAHALGLHMEQLYSEIERSFRFLSYEVCASPLEKIDRFVLCGGASGLKNFVNFLAGRFTAPVEVANPLAQIEAPADRFDLDYLKVASPSLAAAAGLALRSDK